jgi:hypothetical protein
MRAPNFLGLWNDKDPEGSSQTKLATPSKCEPTGCLVLSIEVIFYL